MKTMVVKSGNCVLCETGIPTNLIGIFGKSNEVVHTGDVVIIWHCSNDDKGDRIWLPIDNPLSVILCSKYTSYSCGSIELNADAGIFFAMGIHNASYDYRFQVIKKFNEVIDGEHWKRAGINYELIDLDARLLLEPTIPF